MGIAARAPFVSSRARALARWTCVRPRRTNHPFVRLSLNRSQRTAALLRTTPRMKAKSYTSDFIARRRRDCCCGGTQSCRPGLPAAAALWLRQRGRRDRSSRVAHIDASRRRGYVEYRRISGRDSGLEAFSHNPSDGSLAPLAFQPST